MFLLENWRMSSYPPYSAQCDSVLLPDGRVQTVTYVVKDTNSGFIADVTYSGEAKYEKPAPSYQ